MQRRESVPAESKLAYVTFGSHERVGRGSEEAESSKTKTMRIRLHGCWVRQKRRKRVDLNAVFVDSDSGSI